MNIESEMERQEQDICDRYNSGETDTAEFNHEMRELTREYRDMAQEAAQGAYDDEMSNW